MCPSVVVALSRHVILSPGRDSVTHLSVHYHRIDPNHKWQTESVFHYQILLLCIPLSLILSHPVSI